MHINNTDIGDKIIKIESYISKKAMLGLQYEVFTININENSKKYEQVCLIGICKYIEKYTVPDFVDCVGIMFDNVSDYRFYGLDNHIEYVSNKILHSTVTFSNTKSFIFNGIEEITLGKSVKEIENNAFIRSSIAKVKILGKIRRIGDLAFASCKKLEEFDFCVLNKCILGKECFSGTHIEYADLSGVNKLGKSSFSYCNKLKSIKLSDELKEIPESCFYYTSIEGIVLTNKLKKINDFAFGMSKNIKQIEISRDSIIDVKISRELNLRLEGNKINDNIILLEMLFGDDSDIKIITETESKERVVYQIQKNIK